MFRFTIRDVLWLMVVVGLGVALFVEGSYARRLSDDNDYLREAIDRSGYMPGGNFLGPSLERNDPGATPSPKPRR